VLGPNGAGKTTLLRVLAGLLRPSRGEVRVLGCSLPREVHALRGRIGYLGHDPLLYRDLSGAENLLFSARLHGIEEGEAERRIGELLEAVGMSRRAGDRVRELSAGMRQRLAICRCLVHEPELLLLDEPWAHLDAESRAKAEPLLSTSGRRSRVVVSHERETAIAGADRLLELDRSGRIAVAEAVA
jgi:heme exporter protein A